MNPIFYIDFYKVGHINQYPTGITQVFSNFTPRYSMVEGQNKVVVFGLQYFLNKTKEEFDTNFFSKPLDTVLSEYKNVIESTLGRKNPRTDHIEWLHRLGYLPLKFYAIPEGNSVNLGVPFYVITNTLPEAFWLPNYIETLLSNALWMAPTSATTAQRYRKLFVKYALEAGETDLSFVDWQGHDFSYRGMSGLESAILSGMGHLLSFNGTDTVPAILAANKYYGAALSCGGSVDATEHSVMMAGSQDGELATFDRLISEVYPDGIVSIVSDTWDLWKVLTEIIPALKDKILARNGKIVIRPDSGDPVKIMCGDDLCYGATHNYNTVSHPAFYGVLCLLAEALGSESRPGKLPLINKAGAIYGDSITYKRADEILGETVRELKLSPFNVVLGIGSYTYQYVTRDVYGFAMKATAIRRNGGPVEAIFKKPITDSGGKVSHKGIPLAYLVDGTDDYFVEETTDEAKLDQCAYEKVFEDGNLLIEHTFDEIRGRVRA